MVSIAVVGRDGRLLEETGSASRRRVAGFVEGSTAPSGLMGMEEREAVAVDAGRRPETIDRDREVCVGVSAPDHLVRRGLVEALAEAGFRAEEPMDLLEWAMFPTHRCALLALRTTRELNTVVELGNQRHDIVIVTLFADPTPIAYREALRSGANGTGDWNVSSADLRSVVTGALSNRTIIPTSVAQSLARGLGDATEAARLEDIDVRVLRGLARGMTVEEVGRELGYSSRAMYRNLASLYRRMGVDKRSAALVQAARWGLLD